jgi:hypothetical protein
MGAAIALLVTWIMPGGTDQPNVINSYQSTFASVEACEAAGDKIVQDAQRMNSEGRAKWEAYGRPPLEGCVRERSVRGIRFKAEVRRASYTFG